MPVKFTWLINGRPLENHNGVTSSMFGKKLNVLSIDPILEEHSGNYSCIAENIAGRSSYTAELFVIG